ncbi:MAG: PPC domain-containing protein [Anaerolineae bacterium]|nr:PPC domain-containing protein [Anaerolineae bacterium]
MRKILGLVLLLALLLPFGVQAQDCPPQLSADDCALFQSGANGLESAQSFTGELQLTSSMSAMGMIDVSVTAAGTVRAAIGADGNLTAAEVYLPAASTESGGFMGMGSGTQENALGLIYVDGNVYIGTGAANTPLESLTWQSTPASGLGVRQGFPLNFYANMPSIAAAWMRETTTPTALGEAAVFTSTAAEQGDAMQALAQLGTAMGGTTDGIDTSGLGTDMLGDLGGMFEGMTGDVENRAALLVTADGQPAGFGVSLTVTTDMSSMLGGLSDATGQDTGLGDLDLGSLFGDSGMSLSVVNQYRVIFTSLNQPVSITAPADAAPLDPTLASTLTGFVPGGLFALVNAYFPQQGLQTLASNPNSLFGSSSTAPRVDRGVIEPGQTINGTLEIGTSNTYSFTAPDAAGAVIALSADFDTYLELENASGEQIASNDDYNGLDSQIGPMALPGAGQYTIIARSFGDFSEGAYTLSLEFVEVTVGGGDVAYGDTVSATRAATQDDRYTFTGSAGDEIEILLTSEDFDTYLELRDSGDLVIAQDDDSAGSLNSLIAFTLPSSGEFVIVARAFSDSAAGVYTLSLTSSNTQPVPTVVPAVQATPTLPPLPTKESSSTAATPVPGVSGGEIRQWASSAEATSEYSTNGWDAGQVVGEPNTAECGDWTTAWATASSSEAASITVMFDIAVIATEINIYQTYNPGAIVSVELVLEGGDTVEVLDSADPVGNTDCPGVFTVDAAGLSAEPVVGVIINLDQSITGNWNEIDAVELVGAQP